MDQKQKTVTLTLDPELLRRLGLVRKKRNKLEGFVSLSQTVRRLLYKSLEAEEKALGL